MEKFKKLIIQNEEDYYLVYDDELQESLDFFIKDENGGKKLINYIKYLVDENKNQ